MKTYSTKRLLSLTAVAAIAGGSAYAAPSSPVSGKQIGQPVPPAAVEKLLNSQFTTGSGGSLAPGFNTIDTKTVTCAKATCTITVGSMTQITTPDGFWAICPAVDGTYFNPSCAFQGASSAAYGYVVGNARASIQVSKGTHSVTTQVYVSQASTLSNWEADYGLYTP